MTTTPRVTARPAAARTAARYRAWRFIHPDFLVGGGDPDYPMLLTERGVQRRGLPGLQFSPRGGIDMVDGNDSIRQAILILLSTIPGERVMRPDYGCHLHRLIFSPNDDTTAGLAIHYVRRAIERWEPRIEIMRLDAGRTDERPEYLDILLVYRVRATLHIEPLTFSFSLVGERL
ncbi:MAG: GPW/gp25 family protein [Anaerolineae bacterium]